MHKPLFRIAVGSVAAVGGLIAASAMPAGAATSGRAETMAEYPCTINSTASECADTPVTFTVNSLGTLNITAPTNPDDLGSDLSGTPTTLSGTFGAVTVTDYRATDPSPWVASVSSTDFKATTAGGTETIPASDATYGIPDITPDSGSGLPLAGNDGTLGLITNDTIGVGAPSPFTLSSKPQAVVTETGADGDNAATWSPTLTVAVPATAVVGNYSAIVTHSVT